MAWTEKEIAVATAVGSVIVGWTLNELSGYVKLRREDKRKFGPVLVELLQIRFELKAVERSVEELRKILPAITPQDEAMLCLAINQLIPKTSGLEQRYLAATDAVAGHSPVLAYRLRSKDIIAPMFNTLRGLVQDATGALIVRNLESKLLTVAFPEFERLVRELAWSHSCLTWWRVRRLLKNEKTSSDAEEVMGSILKMVQDALPPQAAEAQVTKPVS